MRIRSGVLACVLCLTGTTFAMAQTSAPPSGTVAPDASTSSSSPESLSTKLSKSGGVIAPQANVDPGIKVQAPDPHPASTPIIPPSATGGNSAK